VVSSPPWPSSLHARDNKPSSDDDDLDSKREYKLESSIRPEVAIDYGTSPSERVDCATMSSVASVTTTASAASAPAQLRARARIRARHRLTDVNLTPSRAFLAPQASDTPLPSLRVQGLLISL
jgi:hypothetical protein